MNTLEICAATLSSVEAAWRGGADRIELCTSLETGGLTPSAGLVRAARAVSARPLHVLVRPRAGDFHYTAAEQRLMLDDCRLAADLGADGLVVGALTADGALHTGFLRAVRRAVPHLPLTLHRAFDFCRDPFAALEEAADCAGRAIETVRMAFFPGDLDYLRAGGRVSNAAYLGAKILGLHPLIEIDDGKLISTKKYRGSMARVVKKLAGEYALQQGLDRKEIYLIYGQGLDDALRGEVEEIMRGQGFEQIRWVETGCVIAAHSGPGAFGIAGFAG